VVWARHTPENPYPTKHTILIGMLIDATCGFLLRSLVFNKDHNTHMHVQLASVTRTRFLIPASQNNSVCPFPNDA